MILGVSTVGGPTAQAQVVPLNITIDTLPTGLGGGTMPLPNMLYLGIIGLLTLIVFFLINKDTIIKLLKEKK